MDSQDSLSLVIKEHDFQEAKNSLKKYVTKRNDELSLPTVPSTGGLFNLGDHKVTGDELNSVSSQIQGFLIYLNNVTQGFFSELGQVYNAFEFLDRDYITGIVASIKAAEKVSQEEQKDRADIKEIIKRLDQSVEILKRFKADIDKLKHITDVDRAWELIENQQKICESLTKYKDTLLALLHLEDVDAIWEDTEALKTQYSELHNTTTEIHSIIDGIQSTLGEVKDSLAQQESNQRHYEEKINKELSDYQSSTDQRLRQQSDAIIKHGDDFDSAISQNRAELRSRFDMLCKQNQQQISDAQRTQTEALARFADDQASALASMQRMQDEQLATLSSSQEKQLETMANTFETEKVLLRETVETLKRKMTIAYIIAGSASALAIIDFILNLFGIL